MATKITDVLMPLEDEVLFSWTIRMIKHYSNGTVYKNPSEILKCLFGEKTQVDPVLYYRRGLDYFSSNCRLPSSDIFASEEKMMAALTMFPFYEMFLDNKSKNMVLSCLNKNKGKSNANRSFFSDLGMFTVNKVPKDYNHIKFCLECLKESNTIYLKREHQILGNFFCAKHESKLKYIPYNSSAFRENDFQMRIIDGKYFDYLLSPKDEKIAKKLSVLIHQIHCTGLKEDILVIRKKILHRMIELGYITTTGKFAKFEEFCEGLNVDFLYNDKRFYDDVIKVLAGPKYRPNPITYLALIVKLFGNLEECYEYSSPVVEVSRFEWFLPEGVYAYGRDYSKTKWELRK